jgi:hypothetical protein
MNLMKNKLHLPIFEPAVLVFSNIGQTAFSGELLALPDRTAIKTSCHV